MNTTTVKHLHIVGYVQGVGFRESMRAKAHELGISGWVRNRRDGSVEALLRGAPEAVDALIAWARRGPAMARVTDVRINPPPPELDRPYARFERWPTTSHTDDGAATSIASRHWQ